MKNPTSFLLFIVLLLSTLLTACGGGGGGDSVELGSSNNTIIDVGNGGENLVDPNPFPTDPDIVIPEPEVNKTLTALTLKSNRPLLQDPNFEGEAFLLPINHELQVSAIATYTIDNGDGSIKESQEDVTDNATWTSTNAAYGSVDKGKITTTAQTGEFQLYASLEGTNTNKVTVLTGETKLVVWGRSASSELPSDLSNIKQVYANQIGYAALREDGSVIPWKTGGNNTPITGTSAKVIDIVNTEETFAALTEDGKVILWPIVAESQYSEHPTNTDAVADKLNAAKVKQIIATQYARGGVSRYGAYAALTDAGNVIAWGNPEVGGDISSVDAQLNDGEVVSLHSNAGSFAALKQDGSVIVWGNQTYYNIDEVADELTSGVVDILQTIIGFLAIKEDGSAVAFGVGTEAALMEDAKEQLKDIQSFHANEAGYSALTKDGHVISWPAARNSSYASYDNIKAELDSAKITTITANYRGSAMAALSDEGKLFVWGYDSNSAVNDFDETKLQTVTGVYANKEVLVAKNQDNSIVAWGNSMFGAESDLPDNISTVTPSLLAFAALRKDGTIYTWGFESYGGDNSAVPTDLVYVYEVFATESSFSALAIVR